MLNPIRGAIDIAIIRCTSEPKHNDSITVTDRARRGMDLHTQLRSRVTMQHHHSVLMHVTMHAVTAKDLFSVSGFSGRL